MLHSSPWSESSLLVDVFTREYGRFRLLAKGARRQKTGSRAQLQSFQKLNISWSGRRSLHTLTGVETRVVRPSRSNRQVLASLYYINELVFKFLHANDAHEDLFDAYDECVLRLYEGGRPDDILRLFECALLSEIGYGLILDHDANTGELINEAKQYFYYPEKGPVRVDNIDAEQTLQVSGACLKQLADRQFIDDEARTGSKCLLRSLLTRQVRGGEFRTRKVFSDLLKYVPANKKPHRSKRSKRSKNICYLIRMDKKVIPCPNCGHPTNVSDLIFEEIAEDVNAKIASQHSSRMEKKLQKAQEQHNALMRQQREQFASQMQGIQAQLQEQQNKVSEAHTNELNLREQARKLQQRQQEMDLEIARKMDVERNKIDVQIRQHVEADYSLKLQQKEQQIQSLRDSLSEAKRKSEQGSQESQGEAIL